MQTELARVIRRVMATGFEFRNINDQQAYQDQLVQGAGDLVGQPDYAIAQYAYDCLGNYAPNKTKRQVDASLLRSVFDTKAFSVI